MTLILTQFEIDVFSPAYVLMHLSNVSTYYELQIATLKRLFWNRFGVLRTYFISLRMQNVRKLKQT